MGSIYLITNLINNKKYVGQTIQKVSTRIKEHLKTAESHKNNLHLYNSIRKYGIKNFSVEVLKDNISVEELDKWEIYYIGLYDTYNNGYNNTLGGGGIHGYHHSEETRKKISISTLANKDKIYTPERSAKLSYALKGKPFTEEHRKNISKSRKGKFVGNKNAFYGKHHTEETKLKLRESKLKFSVLQISNASIINQFDTVDDAAKYLIENDFTKAKLSSVKYRIYLTCKGYQKIAYGFNWKYQERCND